MNVIRRIVRGFRVFGDGHLPFAVLVLHPIAFFPVIYLVRAPSWPWYEVAAAVGMLVAVYLVALYDKGRP